MTIIEGVLRTIRQHGSMGMDALITLTHRRILNQSGNPRQAIRRAIRRLQSQEALAWSRKTKRYYAGRRFLDRISRFDEAAKKRRRRS